MSNSLHDVVERGRPFPWRGVEGDGVPAWGSLLEEAFDEGDAESRSAPFVRLARERLRRKSDASAFAEAALDDLDRDLLRELDAISARVAPAMHPKQALREFPVLARLLATRTLYWVEA